MALAPSGLALGIDQQHGNTVSEQIVIVDSTLVGGAGNAFAFESKTVLALRLVSGIVAPLKPLTLTLRL